MHVPGFLIGGTNSGCGKTTITLGIMAALARRGLRVAPFKAGPDYIDPMYHEKACGVKSRNLDSWLLSEETVTHLYQMHSQGRDIAIAEGVMGLFDGRGESMEASSAELSKIIKLPVVLVVRANGMAKSLGALLSGFSSFAPGVLVRGVILNGIRSAGQYELLKKVILQDTGLVPLGYFCEKEALSFSSRHLGLLQPEELLQLDQKLLAAADEAERHVDLDGLLHLAEEAGEQDEAIPCPPVPKKRFSGLRLGIAWDQAFRFYYQDNLDLLEQLGAELCCFSPLADAALPEGISGLYLGGGYPELYARELAANAAMRRDIKEKISKGLCTLAECGGLMYLLEAFVSKEGEAFSMAGVFPGESRMGDRLRHFGYVEAALLEDCVLGAAGSQIRAHEFHYSYETTKASALVASHKGGGEWTSGYRYKNCCALYPHIHFWSSPARLVQFLTSCERSGPY